jgi:ketosteroid isomerase-like protein
MYRSIVVGILLCASAFAQAKTATKTANVPSPALMSRILAAWSSGNPANAAPFYDKSPADVFYDFAPLQYKGWTDYEAGVKQALGTFEYLKLTLHDDARVHRSGNIAWGTATWSGEGKLKNGNKLVLEGRWTLVWEKKGANWLVVHEHFSVPWTPEPESRHR